MKVSLMRMHHTLLALLLSVVSLAEAGGLATQTNSPEIRENTGPFTDASSIKTLASEEERLWYASKSLRSSIRKGGRLYESEKLESYVQSVMDRLYPEFEGVIKVHVINSPVLNAFAIPDGHIYINTGLLSRFDNEAQLATVLAHEGAHFVHRHGYHNQQSVKNSSGFATITAIIGVPIVGLIGNVLAASSIYGYSRELETEADNVGFEKLKAAGYDVKEASKVFEHLATEVKISEIEESVFYSTHPKLKDRIENFTSLSENIAEGGDTNTDQYSEQIHDVRMMDLESELSFGRYKHLIALLSNEAVLKRYPSYVHYYLAEAYRKRNDENDSVNAMVEVDIAIEKSPEFGPSYRTKGMLLMTQGRKSEAISAFRKYLEKTPEAKDASYVKAYIEKLEKDS
jgi:beta-barrel assembly-enhancing protease